MRMHNCVPVAFFALALMAQPAITQDNANVRALSDPIRKLMHLDSHPKAVKSQRPGFDAVAQGLAKVKTYKISSADYPGAGLSIAFDENDSTIIGDASFGNNPPFGFTLTGTTYQQFNVPGGGANEITGINTAGRVVGIYLDSSNLEHAFVETSGILTNIDNPVGAPNTTVLYDINDHNEMVGAYEDASHNFHAFSTTDGVSFHNFDYPGATSTTAAGLDTAGDIVGEWIDGSMVTHGFLLKGSTFKSLDFPGAVSTTAIGINDSGTISGYFSDASMLSHGFIYSGNTFTQVDIAGASQTEIAHIKNNGHITGLYMDSNTNPEEHGFTGK